MNQAEANKTGMDGFHAFLTCFVILIVGIIIGAVVRDYKLEQYIYNECKSKSEVYLNDVETLFGCSILEIKGIKVKNNEQHN